MSMREFTINEYEKFLENEIVLIARVEDICKDFTKYYIEYTNGKNEYVLVK